ncbi:MAG TPA: class I SAM-dependent methyltransferase [Blastocatellia bacterium]|nr:class I SAM-dependent methyltransferase [Blastocatellia bacterium]
MNGLVEIKTPQILSLIEAETAALGFGMASERPVGAMLRTLAASKRQAELLELGTGTGISAAWLLDGMDAESHLTTVDDDEVCVEIARRHLGADPRITFRIADGAEFLLNLQGAQFDLIFADAWPGKFDHLDQALAALKIGGFYVIDDLLPQPNWPENHAAKIAALLETLAQRHDLTTCSLAWSSGLLVATRIV